ncbi:hypothetical protein ABH935_009671 [Catenulispora sp. GAS73]|uniref:hypothetical protein n=1 Tax=Catenulispora sp. GAS73 TaxID=3156269 RepID=UPI0035150351
MTSSRIGRGAIVTLGAAASMAWAAGAANACDNTPPKPTTPNTHDHHSHDKKPGNATPATVCAVSDDDVQYAPATPDGKSIIGQWQNASGPHHQYTALTDEPQFGIKVRLNPDLVSSSCQGSIDVSLASYTAEHGTWETSGTQTFVDHSQTIPSLSPAHPEELLKVKLPNTPGGPCFGQIDLYFGTTVYDGVHGALPHYPDSPTPERLITAWNGPDAGGCVVPPPVTTTTTTTPPKTTTTPPASPSTHPSTPVSSTPPAAPKPPTSTSTTPTTPATTPTPGTPTLAHTGANVGEVSLVALAFFGAGGTAMFASRKAKAADARKH